MKNRIIKFQFIFLLFCLIPCGSVLGIVHEIEITNFVFNPPSPQIGPGDTVRWILVEGTHTTTSLPESQKQWDSGIMDTPGQTFEIIFTLGDGEGPFPYQSSHDIGIMEGNISYPDTCWSTGDVNGDGLVLSVADYVLFSRIYSGELPYPDNRYQMDLTGDCAIDDKDKEMWECVFTNGIVCFGWGGNLFPVATCCFPDIVVGGCCLGDSCITLTEENCSRESGAYIGDGTSCIEDFPCDCCFGIRGNIDEDPNDQVNIVDLTRFIKYMFIFCDGPSASCFPCDLEADINGDGKLNIVDLTFLVKYLFKGGSPPAYCP